MDTKQIHDPFADDDEADAFAAGAGASGSDTPSSDRRSSNFPAMILAPVKYSG